MPKLTLTATLFHKTRYCIATLRCVRMLKFGCNSTLHYTVMTKMASQQTAVNTCMGGRCRNTWQNTASIYRVVQKVAHFWYLSFLPY